ncbi:MAG: hypothetical protein C0596_11335 [Marinilabiliales bacterium]|nr:MAG: hypothetical protein C0596_11335 [Marinilabiliales bacterium]
MKATTTIILLILFCNISIAQTPTANAGNDTIICGYYGSLNAVPSYGTGTWTCIDDEITILEPNNPFTEITTSIIPEHQPSGPYELIWTEINDTESDSDTIEVTFARIPSSEIDFIPAKCFGEQFTIAANEDSLGTYIWNFFDGILNEGFAPFNTTNMEGGNFQNFVRWGNEDTAHLVSLTSINSWGCQSETNIDTVFEPPIPTFNITILLDTCNQGNGAIIFADTLGSNTFTWLNTTIGPDLGTSITIVFNLPSGDYNIRDSYLTANTTYYPFYYETFETAFCFDTITVEVNVYNTFDMTCPDDIIVNEPVHLADLEDIYPQGGQFYLNNELITDFNPIFYEPGVYEIYYNYFDFETDCLGTCSFNIIVNQDDNIIIEKYDKYTIYPNPAKDFVRIETSSERYDVMLTDISGRIILNGQNLETINTTDINNGTYIISLRDENQLYRFKLIVDK